MGANFEVCTKIEAKVDLYQIKVSGLDSNLALVLKHVDVCLVGFGERFYPPKLRSYV